MILEPLYAVVTFVMRSSHSLLAVAGFDPGGWWSWALSVVGLVVVIRVLLTPLFVKQITAQRRLQTLQPEIKRIQEKYAGKTDSESRQKQSHEMMKLYRDTGTNPLSSFLPVLAQLPFFFALFHVLNRIGKHEAVGVFTAADVEHVAEARMLGASIADRFIGAGSLEAQAVTAVLILLMSWTAFLAQRQLIVGEPRDSQRENPFVQQQRLVTYILPTILGVSGLGFPVGVLIYWLTSNLWTIGQQFFVIGRGGVPDA